LNTALDRLAVYQSWRAFDPGRDKPVDQRYAALPALTKADIRRHFPAGLLPAGSDLPAALASGEVSLIETSGTTADRVINIWNQKWWDASEQSSWKLNAVTARIGTGDHREAILVNPRNVGFISDVEDLPMEKRRMSRFLYLNEKTDPLSWSKALLERMIAELNIFQPVILEANPSYLARLSRYISAQGKEIHQPGAIVFTYEYPTHFHRCQIAEVFKSPQISSYGTTETGYVFMQCEAGKFHQNTDYCRVDFQPLRTEYGGPCLGRILVTPLRNPWNYYLRFDTGDLVTVTESACPCGERPGVVLSSINGRNVNLTLTTQGRPVTLKELDDILSSVPGFEQYQLEQTQPRTYQLRMVAGQSDKPTLERSVMSVLKDLYGSDSTIGIHFVKDLAPESSGKYLISRTRFPVDIELYLDDNINK
jgi:phenylacetate-CoA ligase